MSAVYTAAAASTGEGRNGHVRSSDGQLDTDVAVPTEMGGPGGATNPEQMFAAGYAACFHNALLVVARREKAQLSQDTRVDATASLFGQSGGYHLAVGLTVSLPGLEQQQAEELVQQAHQVCPYSNATRGNIDVELTTSTS